MKEEREEKSEGKILCPICGEYIYEDEYDWYKEMCVYCAERMEQ